MVTLGSNSLKKLKELITSAVMAGVFIFVSGIVGFSHVMGWFSTFCFYFHLIPFGIAFSSRNGGFIILAYYLLLWVVLTLFFLGAIRLFVIIFKRSA